MDYCAQCGWIVVQAYKVVHWRKYCCKTCAILAGVEERPKLKFRGSSAGERRPVKADVGGSNPSLGAIKQGELN